MGAKYNRLEESMQKFKILQLTNNHNLPHVSSTQIQNSFSSIQVFTYDNGALK